GLSASAWITSCGFCQLSRFGSSKTSDHLSASSKRCSCVCGACAQALAARQTTTEAASLASLWKVIAGPCIWFSLYWPRAPGFGHGTQQRRSASGGNLERHVQHALLALGLHGQAAALEDAQHGAVVGEHLGLELRDAVLARN